MDKDIFECYAKKHDLDLRGLDANFSVQVILMSGRYCENNSLYICDNEDDTFSILKMIVDESEGTQDLEEVMDLPSLNYKKVTAIFNQLHRK